MNHLDAFFADQGQPEAYGKSKQFTARPSKLYFISAYNKGAGTVWIELYDSAAGADGAYDLLPCPTQNMVYFTQFKMRRGIFIRAVDGDNGGALIAANDVKFSCRFADEIV